MTKLEVKKTKKKFKSLVGLPPGTLLIDPDALPTTVSTLLYDKEFAQYRENIKNISEIPDPINQESTLWINIEGLANIDILKAITLKFKIPDLQLEDVLTGTGSPKLEDIDNGYFFLLRRMCSKSEFVISQVNIFLINNVVIVFNDQKSDLFETVKDRILKAKDVIRQSSSTFLCVSLIDCIIDSSFEALEHFTDKIEHLDTALFEPKENSFVYDIQDLRRKLFRILGIVTDTRHVLEKVMTFTTKTFAGDASIRPYIRDCYDHIQHQARHVEALTQISSDMLNIYQSSVTQKLNETMNVLTIVSTIFIPLTFITGLYGMNFNKDVSPYNMPELNWYFGYPIALGVMFLISMTMLIVFHKKGWINLNIFKKSPTSKLSTGS